MRHMGGKKKTALAVILSAAMIMQCLTVSATPETQMETEAVETSETETVPKELSQTEENTEPTEEDAQNNFQANSEVVTGGEIYVNGVEFKNVMTGTEPFDADDSDGNDSSASNSIIRSYDKLTYNIEASYQTPDEVSVEGKKIFYALTVPNDNELQLDWSASGLTSDVAPQVTGNEKTYTFSYDINTQEEGASGAGKTGHSIVFDVLGMKKGDTIQPSVKCWIEGNEENRTPDDTINSDNTAEGEVTTVTTAPAYNIILKQGASGDMGVFKFDGSQNRNFLAENSATNAYQAPGYSDNQVTGYGITWGIAVEMRKTEAGKGIRGVEYPDPNEPLTFDVDISGTYQTSGQSATDTTDQWTPILYRVRENKEYGDHIYAADLPGSNQSDVSDDLKSRCCLDSGNYTVTQEGTKLHFSISGYQIDRNNFPKTPLNGNGSYYTDLQNILDGVFTSAQFTVVYPMENAEDETIQDKLGETGNYLFKAAADNLRATSIYNTETNTETIPLTAANTDNISEISANVVGGHGRTQEVYFSHETGSTNGSDNDADGSMKNKNNDSDSATLGSTIYFSAMWSENRVSFAYPVEGRTVAADQLVLFDGDAIEIDQPSVIANLSSHGYTLYPMYATASNTLSFDEIKSLTMDSPELLYWNQKSDIPSGQKVVGILYRWRGNSYLADKDGNDANASGRAILQVAQTKAHIKSEAEFADKVYSITIQSKFYDTSALPNATGGTPLEKADYYREEAQKELLGDGPLAKVQTALTPVQEMDSRKAYTSKPFYDESGYHYSAAGEASKVFGRDRADSLYVVPYYTQITKTIAQRDGNENQKTAFNLDRNERYVDYKLTGSLNFSQGGMSFADGSKTTDITITDKIPAGLTYIDGSAVWNPSSYEEESGEAGQLTGGETIEPTITEDDSDGSKILTWKIQNVPVKSGDLPPLYYSCQIDREVNDNTQLKNTAEIWSSGEHRVICSYNKNTSDVGIQVNKSSGLNIHKSGNRDLELNDDATFTLVASNAQNTPENKFLLVDSMPLDDCNGTVMKGKYNVTDISIDGKSATDGIQVYYTEDTQYAGQKELGKLTYDGVSEANGWIPAAKENGTDGNAIWKLSGWPAAIAILDPVLGANATITAALHYQVIANAGDHLVNYLMTNGTNGTTLNANAKVTVYDRALSGTVWIDDNTNGLIDPNEEKVSGVKVQLLRKNTNSDKEQVQTEEAGDVKSASENEWIPLVSYTDTDGQRCSASQYTDDKGDYAFIRLPKGEYRVIFSSGDKPDSPKESDLTQYVMTQKLAGEDASINSKTDPVRADGKLAEGEITDISMPTISEMKAKRGSHYELPFQNMGLHKSASTETPEITETPDPSETPEVTETPDPSETPEVTETPDPRETPKTTETPKPEEPPVNPTDPQEPTNPDIPKATDTPTPENPSDTPKDTPTPTNPTDTPKDTSTPTNPTDTPKNTPVPTDSTEVPADTPKEVIPPAESTSTTVSGGPSATAVIPAQNSNEVPEAKNEESTTAPLPQATVAENTAADHRNTDTAPVETGDHTHAEAYLALLILAGGFIAWEMIRKEKRHQR